MPLPLIPVLLGGLATAAIAKKVISPNPMPKIPSPIPKVPTPTPSPVPVPDIELPDIVIRKVVEKVMEDNGEKVKD